jgi:uncharacterized membrane protein YhfC
MNILYLTHLLNALIMIAVPIALSAYLVRRFKTGWRLVWVGALTFILSQVGHIPFNIALNRLLDSGILPQLPEPYNLVFISLVFGLSAGIWEETARYVAYRWPARNARTWGQGLVLGSGHGGVESIILGFLVLFTFIQMIAIKGADLSQLVPADQLALAQAQVDLYWSLPWYDTLLGAVERLFTLCFHLSASVLVLQCFTRRQIRWLFIAIAWHALLDAVAVFSVSTWGPYLTEGLIGIAALVSIGIIFILKDKNPETEDADDQPKPQVHDADWLAGLPETEIDPENLEETRYN